MENHGGQTFTKNILCYSPEFREWAREWARVAPRRLQLVKGCVCNICANVDGKEAWTYDLGSRYFLYYFLNLFLLQAGIFG